MTASSFFGQISKEAVWDEPFAGSEIENSKYLTLLFKKHLESSTVILTTTSK